MIKHYLIPILLLIFFSCQEITSADQNTENENTLQIETIVLQHTEGDCSHQCLEISLHYPTVKNGPPPLKKEVAIWTNDFLISLLDSSLEPDSETSLSSATEGFIEDYKELILDAPDMEHHYSLEVSDTILLQNEKHLTLRMNAYIYMGGAHPNSTTAVATFDLATGKRLRPVDLVHDLEKLYTEAEKRFRETQKEAFADGFDFDESWPFDLAENVGLTTEGLFFCYVPYEVAPYVLGFTEFVIPYEQLEKL